MIPPPITDLPNMMDNVAVEVTGEERKRRAIAYMYALGKESGRGMEERGNGGGPVAAG